MTTTTTLQGSEELMRIFALLPVEMERSIITDAAKEALQPMLNAARQKCPIYQGPPRPDIEPGKGRDSLKIKVKRGHGSLGAQVVTGEGDFKGDTFYMSFLEFGHGVGKRGSTARALREHLGLGLPRVPEHPFLRPAFDETKDACAEAFGRLIIAGISSAIGKPI
jgi:HK97 gp10 family phage protein